MRRCFPRGLRALILALGLALPAGYASGQEIAAWLSGPGSAYASARVELLAIAAEAGDHGLPETPLVERLSEGAGKGITPPRLVEAIRAELGRLEQAAALFAASAAWPDPKPERAALLTEASILLRSGFPPEELGAVIAASASPRRDAAARARDALSAAGTAWAVDARFGLEAGSRIALARSLLVSALPRERYASLLALFAKGRASGLSTTAMTALAIDILGKGGGLERLDQEIQRRSRK